MDYAVIKTGGRQYTVRPGDTLDVGTLPEGVGSTVELESVLLVSRGGEISVGKPTVHGAKVIAQVQEHGRAKKIIVFKYKPKVRYRRTQGHRQGFTRLSIQEISVDSQPLNTAPKRMVSASSNRKWKADGTQKSRGQQQKQS